MEGDGVGRLDATGELGNTVDNTDRDAAQSGVEGVVEGSPVALAGTVGSGTAGTPRVAADVELNHEPEEEHDEELLESHAGEVDVETRLDGVSASARAGHDTTGTLDTMQIVSYQGMVRVILFLCLHKGENVSTDKPLGNGSGVDATDSAVAFGEEEVGLASKSHVDKGVDPERSEQEENLPCGSIANILLVLATDRV